MEHYLLSCDWGTSSFRLGLYDLQQKNLVMEIHSKDGVSGIYRMWQSEYESRGISKEEIFKQKLKEQIDLLSAKLSNDLTNIIVVVSGMASSSIGMKMLPYADLPFALDGSNTKTFLLTADATFPHDIILISGVKSSTDVMRGEETQLIGLLSLLGNGLKTEEAIMIFPGTHSKHIHISDGELIHFHTYMTGEIYEVLGKHSILKDSIAINNDDDFYHSNLDAFKEGIDDSVSSSLLNGLFTVRTQDLFQTLGKRQNAYYLSGLLIGNELNDLNKNQTVPLFLCSSSSMYHFYKIAIEKLNLLNRTTIVPMDVVDQAAIIGQVIIQQQLKKQTNSTEQL